jgi:hypothetical protein
MKSIKNIYKSDEYLYYYSLEIIVEEEGEVFNQ